MSESSFSDVSDWEELTEIDMLIQEFENEQKMQNEGAGPSQRRRYVKREREQAEARLLADYFVATPKYNEDHFRRRYRMSRKLFLEIVKGIETYIETHDPLPAHFDFFRQRRDAIGLMSFSVIMKCTCALRQLAYGVSPDALDEYLQIGEHCARDCLDFFTMCIIQLYAKEFLRTPDENDIRNLYHSHYTVHKIPGMLGSIDCMHWEWKNCPKEWQGQFHRGDKKYPTLMLEAVASYDLWIWPAFFGVVATVNDFANAAHSG